MTYLGFHLAFNLPALAVLLWLTRRRLRPVHGKCLAALCGIVLVATTPWDNWAVHEKIWDFDWRRVTPVAVTFHGAEWRLPVEEYAFFLIETVLVVLLALMFLPPPATPPDRITPPSSGKV